MGPGEYNDAIADSFISQTASNIQVTVGYGF